ncbi:hypothetical protein BDQ12DRAFT_677977 [Crucibulum laeve]|uniref:Uncharacterized protein n=1 Tax=Crucibulum laeve TaxID=68775 RepID=A0A5C3M7K2_9AGAR|nr:hypothetical protein BDQ12DRAFT_677977 [Crucibulum laeve]
MDLPTTLVDFLEVYTSAPGSDDADTQVVLRPGCDHDALLQHFDRIRSNPSDSTNGSILRVIFIESKPDHTAHLHPHTVKWMSQFGVSSIF